MALLSEKTRVLFAALLSASILCIYVGKVAQDSTSQEHGTPMKLSSIFSSGEMKKKIDSSNGAVDSDTFLSSYLNGADVSDKDNRENRGGGYGNGGFGFDLWMVDKHHHHAIMDSDEEKKKDGGGKVDAFAGKEKKDMDSNIPKEMKKGDVMFDHISSLIQKANFSHWYRVNSDEKVVGENVEDVAEDNLKNNVASTAKYFRNLIGTSKKKARAEGDDVAVVRNLREDVATTTSSLFKEPEKKNNKKKKEKHHQTKKKKEKKKSFLEKVDSTHHHDGNVDGDGTADGVKSRKLESTTIGDPYFRLKETFYEDFTYNSGDDIAASDDLSVLAMSSFVLDSNSNSVQNGSFLPKVTVQKHDTITGNYEKIDLDLGDVAMGTLTKSPSPDDALAQLAVSGDGKTIAVAQAFIDRGTGDETGVPDSTVKIFTELDDGSWSLRDTRTFNSDKIGVGSKPALVVSLNENGDYLLVGRRYFSDKDGRVDLYAFNQNSGEYEIEKTVLTVDDNALTAAEVGSSVMITRDGSCFIFGSKGGNGGAGSADIWCKNSNGEWIRETTRYGTDRNSDFGFSVAITSVNGNMAAAVGARLHDSDGKVDAGLVQVFMKLEYGTTIWEQLGSNIFGQRGQSIENYYVGDEFGFSISLGNIQNDNNGGPYSLRIAIGAPNVDADMNDLTKYYHGEVSLHEINNFLLDSDSDWNEIGDGINGQSKDSAGSSVILRKDGKSIAVASPDRGENNEFVSKGIVQIYLQDEYSDVPSQVPSNNPSTPPSDLPSAVPSSIPSNVPSTLPSMIPSQIPSNIPSDVPSALPSIAPSLAPSDLPSSHPSNSQQPSSEPSLSLKPTMSDHPSRQPSKAPSSVPSITARPSLQPSPDPSTIPSSQPSVSLMPSSNPTAEPLRSIIVFTICSKECLTSLQVEAALGNTVKVIGLKGQFDDESVHITVQSQTDECGECEGSRRFLQQDTSGSQTNTSGSQTTIAVDFVVDNDETGLMPDPLDVTNNMEEAKAAVAESLVEATGDVTLEVTAIEHGSDAPSSVPSSMPSNQPSVIPSDQPSGIPSDQPSDVPSDIPSDSPSFVPSNIPSDIPSDQPSTLPSFLPSNIPSDIPSDQPSTLPSSLPSDVPSDIPSDQPSSLPSSLPSNIPSDIPSTIPSDQPSSLPSSAPSDMPSLQPSPGPSSVPSNMPSSFVGRQFIIKSTFSESAEDLCLTANALIKGENNLYIRKCQLEDDDVKTRQVWIFNDQNGLQLAIPSRESYCLKSIYRQLQLSSCSSDGSSDSSVENFEFVCPTDGDIHCKDGMLKQSRPSGKNFYIGFTENRIFEKLRFFRQETTVNDSLNTWSLVFSDSWQTPPPIPSSTSWRLWTTTDKTNNMGWDVQSIQFFPTIDCTGTPLPPTGTAISSGYFDAEFAPENAFVSGDTFWRGLQDINDEFYIGMEFSTSFQVGCVRMDHDTLSWMTTEVHLQMLLSPSNSWESVAITKNLAIAGNVIKTGVTTQCTDSPIGWYESGNEEYTCEWYAQGSKCKDYGDDYVDSYYGITANMACCICGGGATSTISPVGYLYCHVEDPSWIGDGGCDGGEYNTEVCGWDGGDCEVVGYPDCHVEDPSWIGDGGCDGGEYNTVECGWDGGDCEVEGYPDCHVDNSTWIGDGGCDAGKYNTEDCGWDGEDCIDFNTNYPNCDVEYPFYIGDGECDAGKYNTEDCGWDGEDCIDFNTNYPDCHVEDPSWIGDGGCDAGKYNTEDCGWDGEDCIDFNTNYPNCDVEYPFYIGDGECDAGKYNTEDCGWDGEDCIDFNTNYPDCHVEDPSWIGDGGCDAGKYNTEDCGWDGEDCIDFNTNYPNCDVEYPFYIGDGECDAGKYNTEDCGWDGEDCIDFNTNYPDCHVEDPSWIGDGGCDGGKYNTEVCGWDGGDCDSPSSIPSSSLTPSLQPSSDPSALPSSQPSDETEASSLIPSNLPTSVAPTPLCKKFKRNGNPNQHGTVSGPQNYSADDGQNLSSWCSSLGDGKKCCSGARACYDWSNMRGTTYEVCENSCNGKAGACEGVARNSANDSTIKFEAGSCSSKPTDNSGGGSSCEGMAESTTKRVNIRIREGSCTNRLGCYEMARYAINLESIEVASNSCTNLQSCYQVARDAKFLTQISINENQCNSSYGCRYCGKGSTFSEALQLTQQCCAESGSAGTTCQYSEPSSIPSDQPSSQPSVSSNPSISSNPSMSSIPSCSNTLWSMIGDNINGEEAYDNSGYSLSLSSDGGTVAIGAPWNGANNSTSGYVRVYQFDNKNTSWVQLGQDIDGEAAGDNSGYSVSLSSDGRTLAIGADYNDNENGSNSGHVRIYQFDNDSTPSWEQLGQDIDGEAAGDRSGYSVSLSSDGRTVAIGARYNDGNGVLLDSGHVRIFQFQDSTPSWEQLGQDIDGEAAYYNSGYSVSLSSDGRTVAIGAPYNYENGYCSGHVRVYQFQDSTPSWEQLGQDIESEAAYDISGSSVSLSSNGRTVAIGAYNNDGNGSNSGHVRIYQFQDSTSSWEQLGQDIDGEAAYDRSGYSVSLSSDDGRTVAISAPYNDGNGQYSGHVRIYKFHDTSSLWYQLGQDIDGEAAYDISGSSVSLSSDGRTVAIGAPGNDKNGYYSGHVRVYKLVPDC
ncbi:hypothetical protein CTEN210_08904 [Chaetoceros tenuissimus]|uniref:Uncharacterized protein n=1 Tax=Chaetoceros tenuissimus TaxID=426638 RepID=A0AAD3H737_9STRA|nr:hypothetical protein CTEN210_08904 [Chaetoceros tenuissimus]